MDKTRAVVFLNGEIPVAFKPKRQDFLIGVDGGTKHLTRLGFKPDIIIGDLDSLPHPPKGVPIIKYPVDKDQTDSELALNYAIKQGFKEIVFVGFVGQRLDHMISNLFLAVSAKAKISFVDQHQTLYFVRGRLTLNGRKGELVSLIPLSGSPRVTTTGFKWPLKGQILKVGMSLGVSNVMTSKKATISVSRGTLLVCYNHI